MQAVMTVEECCEPCLSGDHDDHHASQVIDYQGIYIGDQMRCRCNHGRRLPRQVRQTVVMMWTLLMILGAAFQLGLWLMLYG